MVLPGVFGTTQGVGDLNVREKEKRTFAGEIASIE